MFLKYYLFVAAVTGGAYLIRVRKHVLGFSAPNWAGIALGALVWPYMVTAWATLAAPAVKRQLTLWHLYGKLLWLGVRTGQVRRCWAILQGTRAASKILKQTMESWQNPIATGPFLDRLGDLNGVRRLSPQESDDQYRARIMGVLQRPVP